MAAFVPEFLQWADQGEKYADADGFERARANLSLALAYIAPNLLTEARALRVQALDIARQCADLETQFLAASYVISTLGSTPPRYLVERIALAREAVGWSREGACGSARGADTACAR